MRYCALPVCASCRLASPLRPVQVCIRHDEPAIGPILIGGDAGDEQIRLDFVLRCSTGSEAMPCLSANMKPVRVMIRAENRQSGKVIVEEHDVASICAACANRSISTIPALPRVSCGGEDGISRRLNLTGDSLLCAVNVNAVDNYVPLIVSATSFFADGSKSAESVFRDSTGKEAPFYASPWVTPSSIKSLYGVPQGTRGAFEKGVNL